MSRIARAKDWLPHHRGRHDHHLARIVNPCFAKNYSAGIWTLIMIESDSRFESSEKFHRGGVEGFFFLYLESKSAGYSTATDRL